MVPPMRVVERIDPHRSANRSARQSLKHLTELAERTLAIEGAIKAQSDQLLRMEQAILAFERDEAIDRHAAKGPTAKGPMAKGPAAKAPTARAPTARAPRRPPPVRGSGDGGSTA
jgi:hypothetical protein